MYVVVVVNPAGTYVHVVGFNTVEKTSGATRLEKKPGELEFVFCISFKRANQNVEALSWWSNQIASDLCHALHEARVSLRLVLAT